MLNLVLFLFIAMNCLAWAIVVAQARRFSAIEEGWRQRERVLVDRLLQRAGVAPLVVEREQVLRLQDESPAEMWADIAMREDAVLEEIEQSIPSARGMSPAEARDAFPMEWERVSNRLAEEKTPLRV